MGRKEKGVVNITVWCIDFTSFLSFLWHLAVPGIPYSKISLIEFLQETNFLSSVWVGKANHLGALGWRWGPIRESPN